MPTQDQGLGGQCVVVLGSCIDDTACEQKKPWGQGSQETCGEDPGLTCSLKQVTTAYLWLTTEKSVLCILAWFTVLHGYGNSWLL